MEFSKDYTNLISSGLKYHLLNKEYSVKNLKIVLEHMLRIEKISFDFSNGYNHIILKTAFTFENNNYVVQFYVLKTLCERQDTFRICDLLVNNPPID